MNTNTLGDQGGVYPRGVYPNYRWYVLAVQCVTTVALSMLMISPAPLMGVISKSLHMELGAATASMMASYQVALCMFCIIGGFICDRYGLVFTFLAGSIVYTVPTLLFPLVGDSLPGIVIVRILQACGAGPIMAATSAVAALWFPPAQRAVVIGVQGAMVTLGVAVGFVAGPALFASLGNWPAAMAWQSAGGLVSIVLCVIFAFGPKPPQVAEIESCSPAASVNNDFKLAMRQPVSWVGLLVIFMVCWVFQGFNDLTPGYFALDKPVGVGYGPMTAGKLMSWVQVAFILGSIATGFALEKVFKGNIRSAISVGYVLFAVAAITILFPGVFGNMVVLVACLGLAGFFLAWVMPNALAFVAKYYPPHISGKLVGLWMGVGLFGGTFGILGGATALSHTGNYHASIVIVSIVALIGLVITQFLKPPKVFCATDSERASLDSGSHKGI
jgi:MFS family permease